MVHSATLKKAGKGWIAAAVMGLGAAAHTDANPAQYQPDETASTDVFVYEFSAAAGIDLNSPSNGFGNMLPTIKTGTGHEIRSLIHFDLPEAGVTSIDSGETALLQLFVSDITASGFGINPTATDPAIVDLFANDSASSAFTESTKWPTKPANTALLDSETIRSIDGWVSFDVTAQVQAWLANPSDNEGFTLIQRALVQTSQGKVGVMFNSSNTGSTAPILTVVPEPAAIGLLALGAILARRRMA